MILSALRGALAAVPAVSSRPAIDAEVLALGNRLAGLPWLAADATAAQRERTLERFADLLNEAVELARRLRKVAGYQRTALTLYGLVSGVLGRPLPAELEASSSG